MSLQRQSASPLSTADRALPHSDSAERCLLATCLADGSILKSLAAEIGAGVDWWYNQTHGLIYRTMADMMQRGEPVDLVTVTQKLAVANQLERVGGPANITAISLAEPTASNWRFHFDILRKRALLRQLIRAGSDLVQEAWDAGDDAAEALAGFAKKMLDTIHFEARDAGPLTKAIGTLVAPEKNDPSELIKFRWLCRGGMVLLAAPTGVGKSSLIMQCCVSWALGRSVFGLTPARPLKCVIIQAENDEGDMAEMRDGVLKGMLLPKEDVDLAVQVVQFREEIFATGALFAQLLERVLEETGADIVIVDPVLHYIGGATSDQEIVGKWLRNNLMPVLKKRNAGCILVHHTNKPPTGKEKNEWRAGDFAYIGSGSAEWANVPRAVLALRSIGSHDIYELCAGKRGGRLAWKDRDGATTYSRHIAHAKDPGVICWHEVEDEEGEVIVAAKERKPTIQQYANLLPETWKKSARTALLTAGELRSMFTAHGWDCRTEPQVRADAVAAGIVATVPGEGRTILVGRKEVVAAWVKE